MKKIEESNLYKKNIKIHSSLKKVYFSALLVSIVVVILKGIF